MKIGMFGIGSGICADPSVAARVAQRAETLGFESLWTGEHVVLPDPRKAPSPAPPEFPMLHPSTVLAYAFYTISPDTTHKFGTDHLIFTVPFPLYGIFRYLYLVHQRQGGGNPADALLNDRPLLLCIALWAAAAIAIVYGPGH